MECIFAEHIQQFQAERLDCGGGSCLTPTPADHSLSPTDVPDQSAAVDLGSAP